MIFKEFKYNLVGFTIGKKDGKPFGTYIFNGEFNFFGNGNQLYSASQLALRKLNISLAPDKCIFRLSGAYDFKVYYDT